MEADQRADLCIEAPGKFFNYSLINVYAPTNEKTEDVKDAFYECLDKTYGDCPKHDVKIVIGDANAQVVREDFFRPIIGTESLHSVTNDNGLRLVNFAAARGMAMHARISASTLEDTQTAILATKSTMCW